MRVRLFVRRTQGVRDGYGASRSAKTAMGALERRLAFAFVGCAKVRETIRTSPNQQPAACEMPAVSKRASDSVSRCSIGRRRGGSSRLQLLLLAENTWLLAFSDQVGGKQTREADRWCGEGCAYERARMTASKATSDACARNDADILLQVFSMSYSRTRAFRGCPKWKSPAATRPQSQTHTPIAESATGRDSAQRTAQGGCRCI
jgi:hypothetical protein